MSNRIFPEYDITSSYTPSALDFASIRPSRLPQNYREPTSTHFQTLERYTSPNSRTTTLEAFIDVLKWSKLPGPVFLLGDKRYIGGGSQFAVYKETQGWCESTRGFCSKPVAIKQPKLYLDANVQLSHASPEARQHLHHVLLEILAVADPTLRAHPNISYPIAWSFDNLGFHAPINLVMEIADYDLANYLGDLTRDVLVPEKYWICRDVAAGLDALHVRKIIHGDIKPRNILLYRGEDRLVAKLTDFGLSIDTKSSMQTHGALGGTVGWQAPEVESGQELVLEELPLADSYSFGLLVWSVLLHAGKCPPCSEIRSRQTIASREIEESREALGLGASCSLPESVFNLLDEVKKRPMHLEELFKDLTEGYEEYDPQEILEQSSATDEITDSEACRSWIKRLPWEMPLLNSNFVFELYSRFREDEESISRGMLFAMYQILTGSLRVSQRDSLDVLVASAQSGYPPAQAIVPMAYQILGLEPPHAVSTKAFLWLEKGVAGGAVIARHHLNGVNPKATLRALQHFHATGGYNFTHCAIDIEADPSQILWDKGYSKLHWLAAYGSPGDLYRYLGSERVVQIDSTTEAKETPLYLACARGSWEIASILLGHGACPSIMCTGFGISCIHWLFSFDEQFQMEAATGLIHCGADINLAVLHPVPFFHYPFLLPSGTPLHWAVATFSHTTVRVLLRNGANVLLRDGSDPYRHDDRVRILDNFDSPDLRPFSIPNNITQGLSPLDLAAMQHDPYIFECLLSLAKQVDINAFDEEGFTVLHRLSSEPTGRTRDGTAFDTISFGGRGDNSAEKLNATIAAITRLGGDLNKLTVPSQPKMGSYTPLMLALLYPAFELVRALLTAGASVSMENNFGETVLHCLPQDPTDCIDSVRLIVSHRADINHRSAKELAPIMKAAYFRLLEVAEFLLSAGADIEERDHSAQTRRGTNIFGCLASASLKIDEDKEVARLLETYVFSCPDELKKRRVIEVGDDLGETLLHRFARSNMPCCVEALLRQNAPVNALHNIGGSSSKSGTKWYETPLDAVLDVRVHRDYSMSVHREWSIEEYTRIRQIDNEIIAMIERAGGERGFEVCEKTELINLS